MLVAEIEQKQSQIDECQKHSEQYSSATKVKLSVYFHFSLKQWCCNVKRECVRLNLLLGLRASANDLQSDGGLATQIPSEETEDAELLWCHSAGGKISGFWFSLIGVIVHCRNSLWHVCLIWFHTVYGPPDPLHCSRNSYHTVCEVCKWNTEASWRWGGESWQDFYTYGGTVNLLSLRCC